MTHWAGTILSKEGYLKQNLNTSGEGCVSEQTALNHLKITMYFLTLLFI